MSSWYSNPPPLPALPVLYAHTHTPYRMQLMLPVCSCAWGWWARTGKPIRGPFLVDSSSFSSYWLCGALHWGVFTHSHGPVSWSGFMQAAILLRVHRWGPLPCLEEAACRSHPCPLALKTPLDVSWTLVVAFMLEMAEFEPRTLWLLL